MNLPRERAAAQAALLPKVVALRTAVRKAVEAARRTGRSVGLVPTMGALHAGHLSLVEAARRECDFTIVSVFVNPSQFGPQEDYHRYPRTLENDLAMLGNLDVDLVFAPDVDEMYVPGHSTWVDARGVAEPLEGEFRPGHFRGVATVVLKLLQIATPDRAYFGHKDYQQALVVRQLVRDFDVPVDIRVCPTVREPDGLALSSRNQYLSPAERRQAVKLIESLRIARKMFDAGERDAGQILAAMKSVFSDAPSVRIDYLALVDPRTLQAKTRVQGATLAVVAAWVGATRLIDNLMVGDDNSVDGTDGLMAGAERPSVAPSEVSSPRSA